MWSRPHRSGARTGERTPSEPRRCDRLVQRGAVVLTLLASSAHAHSWYDGRCCSGRDCHPVPCDQLSQDTDGSVTFRPTGVHVFRENVLPSQDAQCHLCTSKPGRNEGYGYCAYIRQGF